MLPHFNEVGMGAGGKEGIAFEGSFRFKGCRSGSWSGLPMAKMTKEDNNNACVSHRLAGVMEWENNLGGFSIRSHESGERCDWVQSAAVRGRLEHVVLFVCLFFVFLLRIVALCLFVRFTFPPVPVYVRLRDRHHGEVPHLTPWKRHKWDHWEHDGKAQMLFSHSEQVPCWTLSCYFSFVIPLSDSWALKVQSWNA